MKIIVGSQSIGKKKYFENLFDEYDFEFILASDLGFDEPIENGHTSYENAFIKARHYSKLSGYPCIALDSSLTFLDFPENHEIQVGSHVKSPQGKVLNPIELRDYYMNLAHKHGGKLRAAWIDAYALVTPDFEYCKSFIDEVDDSIGFYLVDECHTKFNESLPLDSISKRIDPFMFYYDYDEAVENGIILKGNSGLNKYSCFVDKVIEEMAEILGEVYESRD